jgi:hypothetical protein
MKFSVIQSPRDKKWTTAVIYGVVSGLLIIAASYIVYRPHLQIIEPEHDYLDWPPSGDVLKVEHVLQSDRKGPYWLPGDVMLLCGYPVLFLAPLFLAFQTSKYSKRLLVDSGYREQIGPLERRQQILFHLANTTHPWRYWIFSFMGLLPVIVVGDFHLLVRSSFASSGGPTPIPLALVNLNIISSVLFSFVVWSLIMLAVMAGSLIPLISRLTKHSIVISLTIVALVDVICWSIGLFGNFGLPSYPELFTRGRENLVFLWSDIEFLRVTFFLLVPYALMLLILAWVMQMQPPGTPGKRSS